jgi:thiol-disulfide isomerase/thioredoxin
MKAIPFAFVFSFFALTACGAGPPQPPPQPATPVALNDGLYVQATYDPARDPFVDLGAAKARASAEGKRILLEIGGDWCPYCMALEKTMERDAAARAAWAESFVVVKVHFSDDQKNPAFFARYPSPQEFPSLYILDADGRMIDRQVGRDLLEARVYPTDKLVAFAQKWRASQP